MYIVLSTFARSKFLELNFPSSRLEVKPNFLQNPPVPTFKDDGYGIFIGRIGEEKGLDCLIEAFRVCPNIPFKIIGDGPITNTVKNKICTYQLNNVDFVGLADYDSCMTYLSKARFLILPSICYEGMPMVLLEAMASGKAAIASNLGAMPEFIKDGVNGLIFQPGSPTDLAIKISRLYENPNMALAMGMEGRRIFLQEYTADKNHQMLTNLYNKAITNGHRKNGSP
jgi:glycosyltransferase involved in cell wall biosynthesis